MTAGGRLGTVMLLLGGATGVAAAQLPSPDSVLTLACSGGTSMADGLLQVEFRADVEPERRTSMAAEAGALFAGPTADGDPNVAYVVVAPGARSDVTADRLIRMSGVQTVSDVPCPPPPPPPPAARADTTVRPDSAARPPAPGDTTRPAAPADTARRSTTPDTAAVRPGTGPA